MKRLTPEQIALGLKLLQERGLLYAPPQPQPSELAAEKAGFAAKLYDSLTEFRGETITPALIKRITQKVEALSTILPQLIEHDDL